MKIMQKEFGEICKTSGRVIIVGDCIARMGKTSNSNKNIGQYGKVTNTNNGEERLKFLENNEIKTLSGRVKKAEPE